MFGINWLLGLGEKAKYRFSRWLPWQPSSISDRTILAIFDLHVTPMLLSKFGVNWFFSSGEEAKNRFSRWRHLGFPIGMILDIFDLQVTLMTPSKFGVN